MKKILILSVALLSIGFYCKAEAPYSNTNQSFIIPQSVNGVNDAFGKWTGDSTCRVITSATAVLCSTGKVLIDKLCYQGATANDYAVIVDSAGIASVAYADATGQIAQIQGNLAASATYSVDAGCQNFNPPLMTSKGAVVMSSAARGSVFVYYRIMRK